MNLDDIHRDVKRHKRRKRIGRGPGSGHGKTSGRGHKGQGSLAGWTQKVTFQGGMMPLVRRVPKRGFNNRWALAVAIVNVEQLESVFNDGDSVTPETIQANGLIGPNFDVVKVLGDGELSKKLIVSAHRFSKSAQEKIENAGGQITVLPGKKPVPQNKQRSNKK
jgi:large subunit ribosomal protein L15